MSETICYTWDNADVKWSEANFTWAEGCIVSHIVNEIVGGGNITQIRRNLSKKDKKILITLITKISSMDNDYELYRSELTKEKNNDINITIKDVEIMAKAVLGIVIEIKNVK